jgi:hypothetical protein
MYILSKSSGNDSCVVCVVNLGAKNSIPTHRKKLNTNYVLHIENKEERIILQEIEYSLFFIIKAKF